VRTCAGIRRWQDGRPAVAAQGASAARPVAVAPPAQSLADLGGGPAAGWQPVVVGQAGEQTGWLRGPGLGISWGHGPVEGGAMLQGADPEWSRSPPTAIGTASMAPGAQADSGLHLLVPAAVAIGVIYPAASPSPRQAAPRRHPAVRKGAPLTENSAGAPAPDPSPRPCGRSPPCRRQRPTPAC